MPLHTLTHLVCFMCSFACLHLFTPVCTCLHIFTHLQIYIYTFTSIYTFTYIYTCVHMFTYIYMFTSIYTFRHSYTCLRVFTHPVEMSHREGGRGDGLRFSNNQEKTQKSEGEKEEEDGDFLWRNSSWPLRGRGSRGHPRGSADRGRSCRFWSRFWSRCGRRLTRGLPTSAGQRAARPPGSGARWSRTSSGTCPACCRCSRPSDRGWTSRPSSASPSATYARTRSLKVACWLDGDADVGRRRFWTVCSF